MSSDEKPLPKPPSPPFGRKNRSGEASEQRLMADEMAMAAAEGRLDDFVREKLPDSEHARNLAMMMMGMTGMMPSELPPRPQQPEKQDNAQQEALEEDRASQPPDEVVRAAQAGDIGSLMNLLAEEHRKRTGEEPEFLKAQQQEPGLSSEEQGVLDELCAIASENKLSIDWVIIRALKRYLDEYRRTGNL